MKKYGVFYGSATGTTESVALKIAEKLGVAKEDVHDVHDSAPDMFGEYEVLVLGTSTWGDGEVEEDWYNVLNGLAAVSLRNQKIALFGCGDQTMSESFCNGVGELYERLKLTGATFIGAFNTDGYTFDHSSAVIGGQAVGLLLDEVNNPEMTPVRIIEWTDLIKKS